MWMLLLWVALIDHVRRFFGKYNFEKKKKGFQVQMPKSNKKGKKGSELKQATMDPKQKHKWLKLLEWFVTNARLCLLYGWNPQHVLWGLP